MSHGDDAFDMRAAPMRIGRVRLRVRDLAAVARFYRDVIGLAVLQQGEGSMLLGTVSAPLLELVGDPSLRPRDGRGAGLFHVAFLLPGRADLGRWLAFAGAHGVALHGASDHRVSEALYLADPEGNGIEIYADHPTPRWRGADGAIRMTTDPLDLQDLLAAAGDAPWAGFPRDGCIGHVHLQIGDAAEAGRFYGDVLGLEPTFRMPGARFFGSGGYHHQVAVNEWNSRGAGRRPGNAAGLDAFEVIVREDDRRKAILARAAEAGAPVSNGVRAPAVSDPWGIAIEFS